MRARTTITSDYYATVGGCNTRITSARLTAACAFDFEHAQTKADICTHH